jgi:hypothetical protein
MKPDFDRAAGRSWWDRGALPGRRSFFKPVHFAEEAGAPGGGCNQARAAICRPSAQVRG